MVQSHALLAAIGPFDNAGAFRLSEGSRKGVSGMRFERLDLNLLVALDVLIEEKSVSAAAKRLHLSQPAVSGALNRLREFFEDDLLIQSGRQMVLTAKAQELKTAVRDALLLIRTRITAPGKFDPYSAERRFRIIASDYVITVLLAEVIAELATTAPGLSFDLLPPEPRTMEFMERGETDLLITIDTHVNAELPSVPLFEDEHAVICWSESPHAQGIDVESFAAAGHAIGYFGPSRYKAFSEIFFEQQGVERKIEMRVPSFTLLPLAVIGTNRLATLQRGFAEHWARSLPITVLPPPFEMPRLREIAVWHSSRQKDEGVNWLVRLVEERSSRLRNR